MIWMRATMCVSFGFAQRAGAEQGEFFRHSHPCDLYRGYNWEDRPRARALHHQSGINASPCRLNWFLRTSSFGFSSPDSERQITENASATTLPILNKSRFESLAISLPPLAERQRIVAEVEPRLSVIEELEAVGAANLQRATRLRQSILKVAFSGGLSRNKANEYI